jgi:hypothetical protein
MIISADCLVIVAPVPANQRSWQVADTNVRTGINQAFFPRAAPGFQLA